MPKSAVIGYKHDEYLCEGFAVWEDWAKSGLAF